MKNPESLKINVVPIHESVLEFSLSEDIFEGKVYQCHEPKEAYSSKFLNSFYQMGDVGQIAVMPSKLRVQYTGDGSWQEFARTIGGHIRSFLKENGQVDLPEVKSINNSNESESGEVQAIKNILRTQVAPGLGAHGGAAEYVSFKEGQLFLKFTGGCQGCSQVSQTVKHGIEALLKRSIPSVKEVIDVTDHTQGENPYFS